MHYPTNPKSSQWLATIVMSAEVKHSNWRLLWNANNHFLWCFYIILIILILSLLPCGVFILVWHLVIGVSGGICLFNIVELAVLI